MVSVYRDLEYLTANWRMILQWILRKKVVTFWIGFVWLKDSDNWWTPLNMKMNIRFHKMEELLDR
jgi:hypothetical protein